MAVSLIPQTRTMSIRRLFDMLGEEKANGARITIGCTLQYGS